MILTLLLAATAFDAGVHLNLAPDLTLHLTGEAGKSYQIQSAPVIDANTITHVVVDGASVVANTALLPGEDYATVLAAALGATSSTNVAVNGTNGADMLARFNTRTATQYKTNSIIIFEMGVNDLTAGILTIDQIKGLIDQYYQKCLAAGWTSDRIYLRPTSLSYFGGNFTGGNRAALNNYILTNYPSGALNGAIEPRIYANGNNADKSIYRDFTHLTALGVQIDTAAMKKKIAEHTWLPVTNFTVAATFQTATTNSAQYFRALEK